ncbi:unnamed protein product [Thelazia callipaeda]|uniref:Nuclear nucleic acid-binding protein C1D n=1 Tax=Thelazia callipaeda TaxID=103827 RepID=A0A0N5D2V0_THECL|nr:unnamed protein product [Thelazia callipaeda]
MEETLPPEIMQQLEKFHEALTLLEETYSVNFSDPLENSRKPPLEKLKIDLMSVFVINSLYWIFLCTHGRKPRREAFLENEMTRAKDYMGQLKELEERGLAPCLNQRVAKSLVRNALWEPQEREKLETSSVRFSYEISIQAVIYRETDATNDLSELEEREVGSNAVYQNITDVDKIEEKASVAVNSVSVKNVSKRSSKEANFTMKDHTKSKKKRL